jgi:hypothetical protein
MLAERLHERMERFVRAAGAISRHAYTAGISTTHQAMTAVDADPEMLDDAVARAVEQKEGERE